MYVFMLNMSIQYYKRMLSKKIEIGERSKQMSKKKKEKQFKSKKPFYKKWWFILLIVLVVGGIIGNSLDNESVDSKIAETISYDIVQKEDISFSNVKRFSWDIVVKEPISIKQFEELSKQIVEEAKDEEDFNALAVSFYDYPEYVGYGYTIGKTEYAPEGDWSKADTVQAGEYAKMDYTFDFMEKDWSKQLTQDEVTIFLEWHKLYESKVTETNLPVDSEIDEEIAKIFNIEASEVKEIIMKQINWQFDK